MSTNPDRIVNVLSQWLARHVGDGELRERVGELGTEGLSGDQADAVAELLECSSGAGVARRARDARS